MSSNNSGGGVGVVGLLGVLFIGLKLAGIIDWSWWWVLSPFWGAAAFLLLVFVLAFTYAVLISERGK